MNEEIISGLRNALERGFSLDDAVQSFINAGYNASEVREAAGSLSEGASTLVSPTVQSQRPQAHSLPALKSLPPKVEFKQSFPALTAQPPQEGQIFRKPSQKSNSGKTKLVILLVLILMVLIGGIILLLLFKEQVVSALSKYLGK